jgi:signal peptidase I
VRRLKRLLTLGHVVAFGVVLAALYFAWGRIFQEGGTGSNVVLGLLLALAVLWVGTNQLGPVVDELFVGGEQRELLRRRRGAFDSAVLLEKATRRERRNKKTKLTSATFAELDAVVADLYRAADADAAFADAAALDALSDRTRKVTDAAFPPEHEGFFAQLRSLSAAFVVALALRTFAVAPFQIPSGSMIPTLLIGDHLFVWRASYGLQIPSKNGLGLFAFVGALLPDAPRYFVRWQTPQPGDVVVFEAPPWVPANPGEDWIKRVVAGPGQQVSFANATLTVDGRRYEQVAADGKVGADDDGNPVGVMTRYQDYDERLGRWYPTTANHKREKLVARDGHVVEHDIFNDLPPRMTSWPIAGAAPRLPGLRCTDEACTVEDGYVFVMGDNRDRSSDGRMWGAVPIDNIKGRAVFIWVSVDGSENSVKLGRFTLPRFRFERIGDRIP